MPSCNWLRCWLLSHWLLLCWGLLSRLVAFWSGHLSLKGRAESPYNHRLSRALRYPLRATTNLSRILSGNLVAKRVSSRFFFPVFQCPLVFQSSPAPSVIPWRFIRLPAETCCIIFQTVRKWQKQQELPFPVNLICNDCRDWLKIQHLLHTLGRHSCSAFSLTLNNYISEILPYLKAFKDFLCLCLLLLTWPLSIPPLLFWCINLIACMNITYAFSH